MKKLLCLLFLISTLLLTACSLEPEEKSIDVLKAAQDRGKFIVGVSKESKPFGFVNENGDLDGFDIDIAKRIAKSVFGNENAIEFVPTNGYDSISMVSAGKVDFLIATMTITPQRQLTINFSEPYYTAGQAILVKENSDINTIKDLNKKKVIIKLNSTSEKTPKKYAPAAILIGYKTRTQCYDAFKNGQADALISDDALLRGFTSENKGYKILSQRLTVEPYGIAVKNSQEAEAMKSQINKVLQQMKADGSYKELVQKWNI